MFSRRRFPRSGRPVAAACALLLLAGPARAADPAKSVDPLLPQPQPADRYQALAARSPFAPPTAPAPVAPTTPPPPPPSWAEKYTLGSVAQIGPGFRVTLAPKNAGAGPSAPAAERLVIISGEENSERITIGNVQWSDQPTQTRITLSKNGVPATFQFDPSAIGAVASAPNNVTRPNPPPGVPAPPPRPGIGPGVGSPQVPPSGPVATQPPRQITPQPGIVNAPNNRPPIRAAPPSAPPPSAPRIIAQPIVPATPRPNLPGANAADDDDD